MSSVALRNSGTLGGRTAYDHIPLEKLIRDGPPDGDWTNAVQCARMKVLQQEIKSDSDGMVSPPTRRRSTRAVRQAARTRDAAVTNASLGFPHP